MDDERRLPGGTGMDRFDAAIVGASIAGSTAAILMARAGLRVALIERRTRQDAFKVLCTHYIQSSATPTIQRLGLAEHIDAKGAIRNEPEMWCRWGWILPPEDRPYGYNVRRQTLDPILRNLAAQTPGVELRSGERVTELIESDRAIAGVVVKSSAGNEHSIETRLVVGADGRRSTVARLAGVREKTAPNDRAAYFAHYAGVSPASGTRSQMWLLEPDLAFLHPNDGGITLLAAMPAPATLPAFKEDPEAALLNIFREVPRGPDMTHAERVTGVIGTADYPIIERPAVPRPGLALAGDAKLSTDPLWAVGCGWAFQMGEWLADAVVPALSGGGDLNSALRRYSRRCRAIRGHQAIIAGFARVRPYNLIERLTFSAAARDEAFAKHFEAFGSRRIPVRRFLSPAALTHAAWVNLRHMLGNGRSADKRPQEPKPRINKEIDP